MPSFHGAQKPHTSVSSSGSQTFNYTGSQQTFTVPSGVSTITIKAWGGQGGSGGYYSSGSYCSTGGKGGYATGDLSVTAGNTVYVYVGGQGEGFATCNTYMQSQPQKFGGWNGGGNGYGGTYPGTGGGGASDIRYGGTSISDRKIIAGGGGGGGNAWNSTQLSNGGAGGGSSGETMANSTQFYNRTPGSGATQSLSLIHISEPTRLRRISYAVFCLKKKKEQKEKNQNTNTPTTSTLPSFIFFLMIRRPPRSTPKPSSAASDVYKRQV